MLARIAEVIGIGDLIAGVDTSNGKNDVTVSDVPITQKNIVTF